jgi:MFS family permease
VPEPEEWHAAKLRSRDAVPGVGDLFRGKVRRITILTIFVCAFSLSAHWAFMYWFLQHLRNLPDIAAWSDAEKTRFASLAMTLVMLTSIAGNFLAGLIARYVGYRKTIASMCVAYCAVMAAAYFNYGAPLSHRVQFCWLVGMGVCQGLFGLFTMYLPPLFPTLLRTTGAGFCYNIGRIVAAAGTVFFGLFSHLGDHRPALFYASFVFLPAAVVAMLLPEPPDEVPPGGSS